MFRVSRNGEMIDAFPTWLAAVEWLAAQPHGTPSEAETVARLLRDATFRAPINFATSAGAWAIGPSPEPAPAPAEPAPPSEPDPPTAPPETPHAELSASGCERWWNCPASVRLSRGMPDRPSAAAAKGTAAHEVARLCLTLGQDAVEYVARTVLGVAITSDMAEAVQGYVDDCRTLSHLPTHVELTVSLAALQPPSPMFGTADFVAWDRDTRTLYVRDFKHGYHAVSAVGNKQLRYYALGVVCTPAAIPAGDPIPERVEITIYQPNGIGPAIKRETFDYGELLAWARELMDRAQATKDLNAPAVAGPWCKFCRVSGQCSAQAEKALADARAEFDVVLGAYRLPDVRLLTPAERGQIHRSAEGVRDFLDAIHEAIEAAPDGTGFKVVRTTGRRTWRDPIAAANTLRAVYEVDPMTAPEVVGPAEAERRVAEKTRDNFKTKKAATDAAKASLRSLTVTPLSGVAVVPEADPRPALHTNGSEFNEVTTP